MNSITNMCIPHTYSEFVRAYQELILRSYVAIQEQRAVDGRYYGQHQYAPASLEEIAKEMHAAYVKMFNDTDTLKK